MRPSGGANTCSTVNARCPVLAGRVQPTRRPSPWPPNSQNTPFWACGMAASTLSKRCSADRCDVTWSCEFIGAQSDPGIRSPPDSGPGFRFLARDRVTKLSPRFSIVRTGYGVVVPCMPACLPIPCPDPSGSGIVELPQFPLRCFFQHNRIAITNGS